MHSLRTAAGERHPRAQALLAIANIRNMAGAEMKDSEVIALLDAASQAGDVLALNMRASLYESGTRGSRMSTALSREYAKRAADKGHPPAQHYFAVLHHYGRGGPVDMKQAIAYYERALDAGLGASAVQLGIIYSQGENGVPRDELRGLRYFERGADMGVFNAQMNAGTAYFRGSGVERDYAKAVSYLRPGADKGDEQAPLYVGAMFADGGYGIKRDNLLAVEYLGRARESADPEIAKLARDALKSAGLSP
jgi:TPR repeat protein